MLRLKYAVAGILVLCLAALLHYFLPQVDVVRIVDTDIKRVDTEQVADEAAPEAGLRSSDVYFVLAEDVNGNPRNYRNEDALLYGKWDSSDLNTRARSIAQRTDNLVAVRHFGWRVPLLSMFPNAISVWEVEPGYRHIPVVNILILGLLAVGLGYIGLRIRRRRLAMAELRATRQAERAADIARKEREQAERETGDRNRALDNFLSDDGHGTKADRRD